ncbi:MAG: BMP family ABC transporter substrate-binding protein [Alphaproteobacteria bacterium]|nr:BMP family ABC transporter substrate-binding protein [Alphaproteobacteria bacterium]MDA8003615.1 BMP family ABC transporter substrate-binding protein [Alphaproteobacteria bacterium]MDA8005498.1 BMP family ABC transporter substrate-binding protein [Alphaproteobacteria bacterium]MDA8013198.1 BMP family ABC transporter substrate-binding protein [Alphaproteobacteria bacterium]
MRQISPIALAVALAATFALAPVGQAQAENTPLRVAFVYLGPVGDHGWTYGHEKARLAVENHFGDKVKTHFVENIPEGPEAERVLDTLVREGYDLIFANAYGYTRHAIKVGERHPHARIEIATGFKTSPQVSLFSARFYEGRYAAGVIAAHKTRTGVIGYIASLPVPEVVRGINAFLLGARSVRPDIRIRLAWVHAWYNPAREADAARVLIDRGADILTQHTDSTAGLQVAEAAGIHGFGLASDMHKFAPNAHIASIVNHWEPYYIRRVQDVLDGEWRSGTYWEGLDAGMVSLSGPHNVSAEASVAGAEALRAIAEGKLEIFAGPLIDRDGQLRAAAGETLSDNDLLEMNWFLEGVEGELPN